LPVIHQASQYSMFLVGKKARKTHLDICGHSEVVAQVEGLAAVKRDELEFIFDGEAIDLSCWVNADGSTARAILLGFTRISAGACGRRS
jgi:hypothetical protein